MKTALYLVLLSYLASFSIALPAFGFLPTTAFWRHRTANLKFTTASQSIFAGNCSGIATVQNVNAAGTATNVASNLTLNLTGTGSVVFYSDSSCMNTTTSITIASGSSSASFYFIDTAVENITITASATNYASIAQNATVATNPYVWTGGGADAKWTTAANWSGGAVPPASTIALFNGTCSSNCSPSLNGSIVMTGIRFESGYSGSFSQGGSGITIGLSGWVQKAGNFLGGTANILMNGHLTVTGGSYQSTSGTLTYTASANNENFSITAPATFTHNSGTLVIRNWASSLTLPAGTVLNNFNIGNNSNAENHAINGSPVVNGTLTFNVPSNGAVSGNITAKGDITYTSCGPSPNALLTLSGGAGVTQNITGAASNFVLPMNINTAGTVVFNTTGAPAVQGPFTYTAGTVTWTNPTIQFIGTASSTVITSNGLQFQNVTFGNLNGANLLLADTMTINGNLSTVYLGCSSCKGIQGGAITLKGNLISDVAWATLSTISNYGIGSPLTFAGTSAQTWKETAGNYYNGTITVSNAAGVTLDTGSSVLGPAAGNTLSTIVSTGNFDLGGGSYITTSLSLNGNTLTKNGGTLKVNGSTVATGSLYGGTVAP
jgi:hypothetical protein